jgi:hypothetical protein
MKLVVSGPFWIGHGSWDLKGTVVREVAPCSLVVGYSLDRGHCREWPAV